MSECVASICNPGQYDQFRSIFGLNQIFVTASVLCTSIHQSHCTMIAMSLNYDRHDA